MYAAEFSEGQHWGYVVARGDGEIPGRQPHSPQNSVNETWWLSDRMALMEALTLPLDSSTQRRREPVRATAYEASDTQVEMSWCLPRKTRFEILRDGDVGAGSE